MDKELNVKMIANLRREQKEKDISIKEIKQHFITTLPIKPGDVILFKNKKATLTEIKLNDKLEVERFWYKFNLKNGELGTTRQGWSWDWRSVKGESDGR